MGSGRRSLIRPTTTERGKGHPAGAPSLVSRGVMSEAHEFLNAPRLGGGPGFACLGGQKGAGCRSLWMVLTCPSRANASGRPCCYEPRWPQTNGPWTFTPIGLAGVPHPRLADVAPIREVGRCRSSHSVDRGGRTRAGRNSQGHVDCADRGGTRGDLRSATQVKDMPSFHGFPHPR